MNRREEGIRLGVVVLFFLSGACSLVYEVVWMRMLTLVFGATAFATSAILSSFFAGLAIGSLYFGRIADRRRHNPLVLYALLEAGVGVCAFLMPVVFSALSHVYVALARGLELGFYPLSVVRFVLSFAVLLVPTTLMGGTLPVIVKYFTRRGDRVGWDVGRVYAVNTLGAVVGTVLAGFFLILFLGVREAAYAAGAVNLVIAAVAYGLSRMVPFARPQQARTPGLAQGIPGAGPPAVPPEAELPGAAPDAASAPPLPPPASAPAVPAGTLSPPPPASAPAVPAGAARLALWAVGLSGFCALALEVLWTRSLVFFLDNSTHAFTTMLTAFLLGIALGSALIARFIDRRRSPVALFGAIEVLIGVSALLAIPLIAHSTPVMERLLVAQEGPWLHWQWIGLRFVTALTVMLLPTVLMGMTVPLVVRICMRHLASVGTTLGRVYFVNTVGGVVGSIAAGFVLIPLLGVRDGIVVVGLLSVAMGVVLLAAEPALAGRKRLKSIWIVGAAAAGAGALLIARDPMTLLSYKERVDGAQVLFYREGVGSTVKVFRDAQGDKFISVDGFPVAGTSLGMLDAQQSLGNTPMLLTDVPGARVNLIGFGAGGASWEVLQYDVSQVDCVELVPAVLEAAPWLQEVNHGVLDHPRFRAIVGDGRNYALITDEVYDVISIDATSPKMVGNGSLYTLEFYQSLRDRLSEDGMAVQWLPFHLLSDTEMRMTVRTFLTVFPHSTVWLSPIRHHALLVGTTRPLRVDLRSLAAKLQRPGVQKELRQLRVFDAYDVLSWFVMGEEELARYAEGARLNTDNHPYLEFTPAMAYFYTMRYVTRNLVELTRRRESVLPLLVNLGDTEEDAAEVAARVARRFQASQHTLNGDILYYLGRYDAARAAYEQALSIDFEEKNWAHPVWMDLPPLALIY